MYYIKHPTGKSMWYSFDGWHSNPVPVVGLPKLIKLLTQYDEQDQPRYPTITTNYSS